MVSLKVLLSNLDGRRSARLELMSGRRPRLVFEGDARGERAEVKNLADEALTDDEVMSLCEAAGGGRKLESIDSGPVTWTHQAGANAYRVTAEMKGREVAASISHADAGVARKTASTRPSRRSQPAMKTTGPRSERDGRARRVSPSTGTAASATVDRSANYARARSRDNHAAVRNEVRDPRLDAARDGRDRSHEARPHDARSHEARPHDARAHEPRPHDARPHDARPHDARPHDARSHEARPHEARIPERERPAPNEPRRAPEFRAMVPVPLPQAAPTAPAMHADIKWEREGGSTHRIQALLVEGRRLGASDLHLVPRSPALFRIAGRLAPTRETFPAAETERAILALVPEHLRATFESNGGVDFALDVAKLGRYRINVTQTLRGLKASLRFAAREAPSLASLGLPPHLAEATHHHQGLVVVTGPTGHGKTTTLAALIDHINETTTHHVITVEDPIEIVHPRKSALITQREVGAHTKSFARALKGALRQDPDVVVVGELRDTETVRIALGASETGHLVLGTMNTPSAATTIEALIDLFPPGDQPQVRSTLAGGLKYIVSQRLVSRADGAGRVVALETLPGSLPLWNLIRDQKTFQLPSLMQRGKGLGVVRLNDSLFELVQSGVVTREEAIASSDAPDELTGLLDHQANARNPDAERPKEDLVGGLLGRAGAFFSRKGGD